MAHAFRDDHYKAHSPSRQERLLSNPTVRQALDETAKWLRENPDYELASDEEYETCAQG